MPVFLLVAIEHPRRLGKLLARVLPDPRDRFALPNYTGFYVWFNGTTLELAKLLDLPGTATPENSPSPAVIQMVSAYGGYAPDELWCWLRLNVKREPSDDDMKPIPLVSETPEADADPAKKEEEAKAILEAPMPPPRKRRRKKKSSEPSESSQKASKARKPSAEKGPADRNAHAASDGAEANPETSPDARPPVSIRHKRSRRRKRVEKASE